MCARAHTHMHASKAHPSLLQIKPDTSQTPSWVLNLYCFMWEVWNLASIVSCLTWLEKSIWQCLKMPHLYILSFSTIFLSWVSEHFFSSFPFEYFSLWSSAGPLFFLPQEWSCLRWFVLALADHSKRGWWIKKRGLEIPGLCFFMELLMV